MLSASKVTTYLQCPQRYRYEFLEQRSPEFISGDRLLGQAIRATLEERGLDLMAGDSPDDLEKRFLAHWHPLLEAYTHVRFGKHDAFGLEKKGIQLVSLLLESYSPHLILGVGDPFQCYIKGIPYRFSIGWLEEDEQGALVLVEFKTASKKPPDHPATLLKQALSIVGLAQLGWEPVQKTRQITLIKTKEPQVYTQTFEVTPSVQYQAQQILMGVSNAIGAGCFYPNPSYLCQHCPFQGPCQSQHTHKLEEELCLSKV